MKNPDCFHDCTSDCRKDGCNCLCGEWHDKWEGEESLKQKIHRNLNDELEVNKILLDFGFRWWVFGLGCGVVLEWFLLRGL